MGMMNNGRIYFTFDSTVCLKSEHALNNIGQEMQVFCVDRKSETSLTYIHVDATSGFVKCLSSRHIPFAVQTFYVGFGFSDKKKMAKPRNEE